MAPSQASFQDLVAQTSAAKDAIKKSKEGKRELKKTRDTEWLKRNKDVNKRAQRDVELRQNDLARLSDEQMRANMEEKSKRYDRMKRGDYSGISEAEMAEMLFEPGDRNHYPSDSEEDVDESRVLPKREEKAPGEEQNDPIIKYKDEFGRDREGPQSEAPSEYHSKPSFISHGDDDSDDGEYVEGAAAAHQFGTYEPSAERLAAIKENAKEEPLTKHYDPTQDIRDHGAAHMPLGNTEEERQRKLAALKESREETRKNRAEAGAVDIQPGQEGMKGDDKPRNSALEKRKRERDARLELIRAKKQKHDADAFLKDVLANNGSS